MSSLRPILGLLLVTFFGSGGLCRANESAASSSKTFEMAPPKAKKSKEPSSEKNSSETLVQAQRTRSVNTAHAARLADADLATSAPEEALERLPDVDLVRNGGPLTPTRLMLRGLSGARTRVLVDGMPLDDPSSGAVDAADFLGPLARNIKSDFDLMGGSRALSLTLDDVLFPRASALLGIGSLNTRLFQLMLSVPFQELDDEGGSISVAVRGAETQGNFRFQLTKQQPFTLRENNDQRRLQTWIHLRTPTQRLLGAKVSTDHLLLAHLHEGGIAGFAAAPLANLRGASNGIAGRSLVHLAWKATELNISASSRLMTQSTQQGEAPKNRVSSLRNTAHLDAAWRAKLPWNFKLKLKTINELAHEEIQLLDVQRGTFKSAVNASLQNKYFRTEVNAGVQLLSDLIGRHGWGSGPLFSASILVEAGPQFLFLGARASLQSRAPSLQEMFGPSGLIAPNVSLVPERGSTAEAYVVVNLSRIVHARLLVFASRMQEAILIAHRNAFELSAINTGPLTRAGLEGSANLRLGSWVQLNGSVAALYSKMDATGAPLPVVAPYSANASVVLGQITGPNISASARHRARTTANLFGTLYTEAYSLLDVKTSFPISSKVILHASVSNLLDATDAKDAYLLPLPGRQFFFSAEVVIE